MELQQEKEEIIIALVARPALGKAMVQVELPVLRLLSTWMR